MSEKKVLVLLGSPRKKGNSARLAQKVIEGLEEAGSGVESFYLHGMDIKPCTACDACRENSSKDCIIEDNMQGMYPKLREADARVFSGPVYWFTVSAQTKLFMDRCYALGGPQGTALKGKRIGIVLTYADPDPFMSGAVNALRTFQDAFRYVGATIAGMVYGSATEAGEIESNQELMSQAYRLGKNFWQS